MVHGEEEEVILPVQSQQHGTQQRSLVQMKWPPGRYGGQP